MNPNIEIEWLRRRLQSRMAISDADDICDQVSKEIDLGIRSIIESALQDAIDFAVSLGAYEFIEQIKVDIHNYSITTISGSTDFSTPQKKMLPFLLKNAKTAADGSRYKTIPISEKQDRKPPMNLMDAMRGHQSRSKETSITPYHSPRVGEEVEDLSNKLEVVRHVIAHQPQEARTVSKWRTASSKQDPENSWVLPSKELDMSDFLSQLNSKVQSDIDELVFSVIKRYEV